MATSAARRVEQREQQTPQRARLADALRRAAAAQRAVESNRKGIEQAYEMILVSSERFEKAQAAIARAKNTPAARMARAAKQSRPAALPSLPRSRRRGG